MRSLKTGLVSIAITGLIGTAALVGCSAEGADAVDLSSDQAPTEPPPPTMGAPTSGGDSNDAPADPPTQDAGKTSKDGGVDSGPPAPSPGDACTDGTKIFTKTCGACGKQSARCDIPDGQTSGTVSDYGVCDGEKQGGCVPGTTQACGNCGTQTCTNSCSWGTCTAQGTCKAGDIDYTTAGCTTAGTYSSRTCSATCSWSNYSTTCAAPVNANKMTLSSTVGTVISQDWTLVADAVKMVSGTCGSYASASSTTSPGFYVEVRNPSTTYTLNVSAYHTLATGGTELDTQIWGYKKLLPPKTDADYEACDFGSEDSCTDVGSICGGSSYNFAGMANISIPPGGKVLIFNAAYSTSAAGKSIKLNLKTVSRS